MSAFVSRLLRRLRLTPGIALLVLSAVLFLAGSATFGMAGGREFAQFGILGAVAAVAVIVAFSG